ncbi:MAG TPA: glycosyltransferase family 4 protein [Thermoanaerobaculia bacterium]|nr:glycosyltransferase family 4 protein [Thermoanaerobaculia bacterium]
MRIAIVEPAGKGGMIHYAWQLAGAMAEAGAEPILITARDCELAALPHAFAVEPLLRLWDPKAEGDAGPAIRRKVRRGARAARYYREWIRLARFLRRLRPDVVQFGDIRFATDLAPLAALRRSGLRLADVCHNVHPFAVSGAAAGTFSANGLQRRLYRRIYRQFDAVFVHFERNRAAFEESFGSFDLVRTIVHGNESIFEDLRALSLDASSLRRELGITPDADVVLLFGTLSRYKGVDLLVDAFAEVKRRVPRAHLVLAGFLVGGLSEEEVRSRAHAAGIGGSVTMIPRYIPADAVGAWMDLASVVVFPYDAVFQSGAVHVPLTFGRPVVATAVGAMSEVIRDGETGLIVPPRDRDALAGAIATLLQDRAKAAEIGRAAAEEQRTRFAWSRPAEVMLETYRELIGGGS